MQEGGYQVMPNVIGAAQVDGLIAAIEAMGPREHGARNLLGRSPEIARAARGAELVGLVGPVIGAKAFPVRALFFDKMEGTLIKSHVPYQLRLRAIEPVLSP